MAQHEAATSADHTRRQTLLMLLQLARQLKRPPKSEEAKWFWFGVGDAENSQLPETDLSPIWALYQASDLFRLTYEVLLYAGLRIVKEAPRGRLPLQAIVARMIELTNLPTAVRLDDWMREQVDGGKLENRTKSAAQAMLEAGATGDAAVEVQSALTLMSTLVQKSRQFDRSVIKWLGTVEHFQSLASEVDFLKAREHLPAETVFADLFQERILKRHLWVASRKFRNQKAYTFLIEPDEGALRFRSFFRVSPSSPRIDQAVQFLQDVKLLADSGITDLGLKELEHA